MSTVSNRASLTLQPSWPQIFRGETITIRCEIDGGGDTQWTYEWEPTSSNTQSPTHSEYRIISATESHSGDYRCKGRKDSYSSTEWSDYIRLTVSSDDTDIPVGGSVTLTCSVNPSSSGWKYFWYRGEKTSEPLTTPDVVFLSTGQIRVSQGGLYWCRGGRGDTVYPTDYSDPITANKAVVTLQPNWSTIYSGEKITLRCEIKDGGDTEWTYEWKTTSSEKPSNQNEHSIRSATVSHSGEYSCKGRMKHAQQSSTEWSDPIKLTLFLNSELLPGSSNGTEQDSYIVHGPTHTAGYKCRAGRGDPVYYTDYSEHKFVWSGGQFVSVCPLKKQMLCHLFSVCDQHRAARLWKKS
uniref:Ig-like domain-containing protein n=1 Tax=Dicentrarchus labrax TaxID=13489 RepID=A0A8C4H5E4_DICLA